MARTRNVNGKYTSYACASWGCERGKVEWDKARQKEKAKKSTEVKVFFVAVCATVAEAKNKWCAHHFNVVACLWGSAKQIGQPRRAQRDHSIP